MISFRSILIASSVLSAGVARAELKRIDSCEGAFRVLERSLPEIAAWSDFATLPWQTPASRFDDWPAKLEDLLKNRDQDRDADRILVHTAELSSSAVNWMLMVFDSGKLGMILKFPVQIQRGRRPEAPLSEMCLKKIESFAKDTVTGEIYGPFLRQSSKFYFIDGINGSTQNGRERFLENFRGYLQSEDARARSGNL